MVVAKNLWIAIDPGWFGGGVAELVARNGLLAVVVAIVLARTTGTGESAVRLMVSIDEASPRASTVQRWAWAVGPAAAVIVAALIASTWRAVEFPWVRLGGIVVGTALLEELIFRGGLASLSERSGSRITQALVPGVAFGLWHLVDAVDDAREHADWSVSHGIGLVALTVVAMTAVSWFVFEPLRRRCGSIVGPWLLHAAVNGVMVVLGASM